MQVNTRTIKVFLDIILLKHPERTVLGALVGLVASIFEKIFHPFISEIKWIDISHLDDWHFILFGIVCLNIPTILHMIFRKPILDESIEKAFSAIKLAKDNGLPESKAAVLYEELCKKVIRDVVTFQNTKKATHTNEKIVSNLE